MKRIGLLLLAFVTLLLGQQPAWAGTFDWRATVEGRVGFGTNPFLNEGSNAGSGLAGFTVAPVLRWREPTSVTELSGSYNRDQYFKYYDHTDDESIDLRRTQQLSTKFSLNGHVGYFSSISGLLSPYYNTIVTTPGAVDQLAVGTRQRRVFGDAGFAWQPNARDTYTLSGVGEHASYSGFGGAYSYGGVNGAYTHTLDSRTKIGVQITAGRTFSSDFPSSSSVQPNLTLQRVLSTHWTFNGGIGLIVEHERRNGGTTSVTPGFNAALCGTYTRLSVCLNGTRQSAASGIGGLRQQTQFGVNATYKLTEHSRLIGVASYGISKANDRVVIDRVSYGNQRYALARLDYQRDLSRRLTAGVGGSYQTRSGSGLPDVHALAITFNLTAKLGRLT